MGRNAVVKEQYTILEQYSSQIDDQALMQMNIHYHEEQGTLVTCAISNRTHEGAERIQVLIVDDQLLVLESLRLLLGEEKDMQVRVAGDGRQAMEACERELPDLI